MAVWATACAKVGFDPSAEFSANAIPVGEQKETFNFNDDGGGSKVDVLFIVDNSGSMADEQARLSTGLNSFLGSIGRIDWQIGITTTDVSNGPYGVQGSLVPFKGFGGKILNKNVPNFENAFRSTVVRDEVLNCDNVSIPCGSGDERPLQALVSAFGKRNTANSGFFRDGADLAVVILSDEDEGSDGTDAIAATAVISAFNMVFGGGKKMSAFAIVIEPGNTACFNAQAMNAGQYGTHASSLASLTGGVTGSICNTDYGPTLSSIGNRVRDLVKHVSLRYVPTPESVRVVITPEDPSLTWTIDGSAIRFNKTPAKGTTIEVYYVAKPRE